MGYIAGQGQRKGSMANIISSGFHQVSRTQREIPFIFFPPGAEYQNHMMVQWGCMERPKKHGLGLTNPQTSANEWSPSANTEYLCWASRPVLKPASSDVASFFAPAFFMHKYFLLLWFFITSYLTCYCKASRNIKFTKQKKPVLQYFSKWRERTSEDW